ncbi:hypothetical protein BCV69DRAFT_309611 [Microstroma glucosiphilum]|uniref:YABBY protein C-terminal domain-containing protein n=1 Tax=Pseudomicrostroma glucosiphilum TaxID=1684307 RepID=A0A316UFM4_9BASI|nr:hypothetical protein BCV69DRAFT_309611 [Pseudomicrostroma glucosiphilum]PWN23738.1 hypothetical protein BCV69DRAFT_309611 [Pseudomicrostroma glucosiphilum]
MPPKKSGSGKKKAPTAYNLYMKTQLEKLKKSEPNLDHKERFKKVAASWAKDPSNPKNKK